MAASPAITDAVRHLFAEGKTDREICTELGLTKNAVLVIRRAARECNAISSQ